MAVKAAVFDLGGVLIDWDPRYLYRKLLADEAAVEEFLATVCTPEWNAEQDRGRPFAEGVAELVERHPAHAAAIAAYHERWPEMLGGDIPGAVELLAELRATGVPLYALTNWSAETFVLARERFEFLDWFDGLLVSGEERMIKPDPAIFELLLDRFGLDPAVDLLRRRLGGQRGRRRRPRPRRGPVHRSRAAATGPGSSAAARSTRSHCPAIALNASLMISATASWPGRSPRAWRRSMISAVSARYWRCSATWVLASSATSSGSACWLKNSLSRPRLRNWGGSSVGSASQAARAARPSPVMR